MESQLRMQWAEIEMFADVLPRLRFEGAVTPVSIRYWLAAAALWVRQLVCGVRGHDMLLRTSSTRIFLECAGCAHQSHGWQLDVRPRFRTAHR
jgi:hypothetical protein